MIIVKILMITMMTMTMMIDDGDDFIAELSDRTTKKKLIKRIREHDVTCRKKCVIEKENLYKRKTL